MYITSSTLRTVAWSALALSTARAQYIIDNLSFGQKGGEPISPNLRAIPHFNVKGDGWDPEILSDRVMLTPPWPGNRRGAIWSEDPLHHKGDWSAELHFRASGMERGGGNLQLWYTKESQKNDVPASLYTAPKFDGLVLVVDQYEGRGGSVRGFLNDGNMDIKAHTDPDTLAFGQCSYAYRNLGRLSVISLKQANGVFEVKIDGNPCFSTNKVKLPEDYYFGITASSAENPDSFEVHKFLVSTTNAYTREEPKRQQPPANTHEQQKTNQQQRQPNTNSDPNIPQMLEDVFAASIKSQQDQFADLHNRVQIINHRVNDMYDLLEKLVREQDERYNHMMGRMVPMHDQVSAVMRNVEKVERTTMETLRDLESKDFKDMLNQVHDAIERSHNALGTSMPLAMAAVVGKERPSMTTFLFIAVAVQIMVFGAYKVYKKRRNSGPKKFL
ncbi:concanavalin A-like lectin/glucanase [Lentithecium fluviatile CBS 122367]|uniref:Concanavalin A-like lectin/glucanase n=1 Tax=Lentithecium fluviatile CBS 122367 TaxID=1168545 RepID=A0A6G1JC55_9PLEO|nr:concanavalin A-like lectin/glucanase [Lentithecium fluviatile CBS 122367]